jgi:hypothetical protein
MSEQPEPSFWEKTVDALTNRVSNVDFGELLSFGAAYAIDRSGSGFFNASAPPVGYQGGIPSYTFERAEVPGAVDPDRRPGSGGQRYFSDAGFTTQGAESSMPARQEQAQGLAALNTANPMRQARPPVPERPEPQSQDRSPIVSRAPARVIEDRPVMETLEGLAGYTPRYAAGGLASLPGKGYYLGGTTDGMADQVPATIDGQQPAALSDGEFVIPADVVSHLGNGNSDAGAKQLYTMMDRLRQERTGTTKQGKQINPAAFMPK